MTQPERQVPVSVPEDPPNYNSSKSRSAWWLARQSPSDNLGDPGMLVMATTGNQFVKSLQNILAAYPFKNKKAYRGGGPLGGRSTLGIGSGGANTNFDIRVADGKWGPSTNAALWRYIAEITTPGLTADAPTEDTFIPPVREYLDAIERSASTRVVQPLALQAAVWAVSANQPKDFVRDMIRTSSRSHAIALREQIPDIIPPPWDTPTPAPERAVDAARGGVYEVWSTAERAIPPIPGSQLLDVPEEERSAARGGLVRRTTESAINNKTIAISIGVLAVGTVAAIVIVSRNRRKEEFGGGGR